MESVSDKRRDQVTVRRRGVALWALAQGGLRRSDFGKAVAYVLSHWPGLTLFLQDAATFRRCSTLCWGRPGFAVSTLVSICAKLSWQPSASPGQSPSPSKPRPSCPELRDLPVIVGCSEELQRRRPPTLLPERNVPIHLRTQRISQPVDHDGGPWRAGRTPWKLIS